MTKTFRPPIAACRTRTYSFRPLSMARRIQFSFVRPFFRCVSVNLSAPTFAGSRGQSVGCRTAHCPANVKVVKENTMVLIYSYHEISIKVKKTQQDVAFCRRFPIHSPLPVPYTYFSMTTLSNHPPPLFFPYPPVKTKDTDSRRCLPDVIPCHIAVIVLSLSLPHCLPYRTISQPLPPRHPHRYISPTPPPTQSLVINSLVDV